ncbi:glycosyltransferase family 4 protein [Opitutus terrae]|uniref:Glycosyl transferase group 1 n=1 Tax=Opitutus terrae (strain DSM 11246 / JCM 15787 / PB90-1) TaxID=452637 RepID=B1ZT33_OPITP|nr:glycosyltransferase family 1 protein [Opitutus terrae]ACB75822.1 glycosyl transferase group 1 [Opitutus terrae PB90-1]
MKLSIVTETFPPEINGVALTFGHVARELSRRNHAVTVFRPARRDRFLIGEPYREVPLPGVPIPGYPLLRVGLPAPLALRRYWRTERPDLVHVVTEGPLGASAIRAARALRIPVTSSFHTNFHRYMRHYRCAPLERIALGWLRRVHNRTRCTFVPTLELREELAQLGFANLRLFSRGVDTAQFTPARRSAPLRARWGAGPDDPVVLHVGRMAAEKNYPLLLATFAAMRSAQPHCRFVLVGDGPLRASLERAHPEFRFTGFVSRDELAQYYASADIYVHASLTETFGNVLTEAMASGLAVAAFDYASARLFIRSGVNGLNVPCAAPDALVDAAVALASSAGLRERLRTAARAALAEQSWPRVIARFEADLLEVIAEAQPAAARTPLAFSVRASPTAESSP